ncbi:MAG: type II toxin-antitoxin system death-on-curing family toxin [Chloroflexales bacterium]|nr:type II toxin-antitoxin system death-on-curing family toxin [Chloroflexales bacterium]
MGAQPHDGVSHLSLSDLLAIRDGFAADDAWRFEIVNSPGLISALTTPFQTTFGHASFPTLLDKAAALVFLLIANHPFRDGNKRIAGAALRLFLERNCQPLNATPPQLEAFCATVAQCHEPRDPRIGGWIAAHVA